MGFRVSPVWWPALAATAPVLIPWMMSKKRRFEENKKWADRMNKERIQRAQPLPLPVLEWMELTVIAEYRHNDGFLGAPGISYLLRTDKGSILFDIGFGSQGKTFMHNASRLGVGIKNIDALVISHLHADHMGGLKAQRRGQIFLPPEFGPAEGRPCYLPNLATANDFKIKVLKAPCLLEGGLASTGPLAQSLYFAGFTEEQALVARIKGKGLVVLTGCGHPTIEVILKVARRLSQEPVHLIGGGLHFPITKGRGNYGGIQLQMLAGTHKPWWQRTTDEDLTATIAAMNKEKPQRILLSAHDTCDHAIARITSELNAKVVVLQAGATYSL